MASAVLPAVQAAFEQVDSAWAVERIALKSAWLKLNSSSATPPALLATQLCDAISSKLLAMQLAAGEPERVAREDSVLLLELRCMRCGVRLHSSISRAPALLVDGEEMELLEQEREQRRSQRAGSGCWNTRVEMRDFAKIESEVAFKTDFARKLLLAQPDVDAFAMASFLLARDAEYGASGIEVRAQRTLEGTRTPRSTFTFHRAIIFPKNWIVCSRVLDMPPLPGRCCRRSTGRRAHRTPSTLAVPAGARRCSQRPCSSQASPSSSSCSGPAGSPSKLCSALQRSATLRSDSTRARARGSPTPRTAGPASRPCSRVAAASGASSLPRTFELAPDAGLLGKSLVRPIHPAWTCLSRGAACFAVLVLQPALTFCSPRWALTAPNITVCLPTALLWWAFALGLALLHFCGCALLFDPSSSNRTFLPLFQALVYDSLLLSLLRTLLGLLALALLPLPLALILFSSLSAFPRLLLDALSAAILLPLARVPISDSWVAKRVSGPGLSNSIVFQIQPEPVLLLLLSFLEREELALFQAQVSAELQQRVKPLDACTAALKTAAISLICSVHDIRRPDIQDCITAIHASVRTQAEKLDAKCERRRSHLPHEDPHPPFEVICLSPPDLATLLTHAVPLVRSVVSDRLAAYHAAGSLDAFWADVRLPAGEWEQLTRDFLLRLGLRPHVTRPLHAVAAAESQARRRQRVGQRHHQSAPEGEDLDLHASVIGVDEADQTAALLHDASSAGFSAGELCGLNDKTMPLREALFP